MVNKIVHIKLIANAIAKQKAFSRKPLGSNVDPNSGTN